jgi:hypothetical protein
MNYELHYNKLIKKALNRNIPKMVYTEKHHIVPKCLGGNNSKSNVVKLLPKEHYIAHMLLFNMYPNNNQLSYAFWMMSNGNKPSERMYRVGGKVYEEIRNKFIQILINREPTFKGKVHSEESKQKISNSKKGKPGTWVGKTHSEESKQKMSNRRKGTIIQDEVRLNMSKGMLGKSKSKTHKENIAKSKMGEQNPMFGKKAHRIICPYCNTDVAVNIAKRFHFDKCKSNQK